MIIKKIIPLLLIQFLFVSLIFGQIAPATKDSPVVTIQESEYTVQRIYDTDRGLPANGITSVMQDYRGYIWASTFNGLVRYDGYRFRVYDMDSVEGLTSNRFLTVLEGGDGQIYAGMEFGSLMILDGNHTEVYHLDQDRYGANISFNTIYEDDSGRLWIGSGNGLFYFEDGQFYKEESELFDEFDSLITQMIYRHNNHIYVLFTNGIVKYDLDQDEFTVLAILNEDDASMTFLNEFETTPEQITGGFWQMHQKGDREYILVHEEGIFELTDEGIRTLLDRREIRSQALHGMMYFKDRTYIYGSDGLFSIDDLETDEKDFVWYNNISISFMIHDHEGSLWMSTHAFGLVHLRETPVYHGDRYDAVSHVPATAILGSSDCTLYVGTNCDELYGFYPDGVSKMGEADGINNRCIWSLLEQSDGTIWVGTWGDGVFRKSPDMDRFERFRPQVMHDVIAVLSLFEDSDGNIWFGSYYNGLFRYDGKEIIRIRNTEGQLMSAVRMLYQDKNGQIYVASDRGIGLLNSELRVVKPSAFKLTRTLNFRTILIDDQGRFWFGSYGGGIVIIDGDDAYTLNRDNGLYDNTVSQMNFDSKGNLWLAGNLGVFIIDQDQIESFLDDSNEQLRVARIGQNDGLSIRETTGGFTPSSFMNDDGELYIPKVRGIVKIDTERYEMNRSIPEIYLEEIEVDGLVYMPDEFENFSHRDRRVIFRFSILSYKNPDHVEFEYLLEGYDDQWQRASNAREIVYTSLPQGRYTLRIRGANNDGFWNDEGVSFPLYVKPPFWATSWFYLLVGIVLLLIIYSIYRIRVASIEKTKHFLEKTVEKRTNELKRANEELKQLIQEKNKMQRVLGHDLRNPLAGIIGYLELLKDEGNFSENEEHAEIMEILLDSSRGTLNLLENLIELAGATDPNRKPVFENISVREMVEGAIHFAEVHASQKEIDLNIKCEKDIQMDVDKNMISSVLRNLISNAIKFSSANSAITVEIDESEPDNQVLLKVIDQGVGMDSEFANRLFNKNGGVSQMGTQGEKGMGIGLQICKDFVEKHNGTIEVTSQKGKGSTFTVKLPKVHK